MFTYTDVPEAPSYVVDAGDKRRARLNCIAHLLTSLERLHVRGLVEPAVLVELRGNH